MSRMMFKHKNIIRWLSILRNSALAKQIQRFMGYCEGHSFLLQIVLIFIYRLSLDLLYATVISPLYKYNGFTLHMSAAIYFSSILMIIPFAPFIVRLQRQESIKSSVIITFLNYLYFIPLTSYIGCKGENIYLLIISALYWMLLLIFQFCIPVLSLTPIDFSHQKLIFTGLTIASSLFVLFISWKYTGFRFTLNFIDVYGIRAEADGYQMNSIVTYMLSAITIILPILLLYWLKARKYVISIILVIVFIFYFSIGAHKSQFFFIALTLVCFFFARKWMLHWFSAFLTLGGLLALLEKIILKSYYLSTLFFRRLMYVPAQLAEDSQLFFSHNVVNLFRNGIMGKLGFDNVYSKSIPYVIGEFNGDSSCAANTGMLGDVFANLPMLLGVLLLPLILILCFRIFDLCATGLPLSITLTFCVFFAVTFINSTWSTTLLTHGFLLTCLLLYFFPKERKMRC